MFNLDKLNAKQKEQLTYLIQGMTTRNIQNAKDSLDYLEEMIIHTRDYKYIIERKKENRDLPNKLYLEFMHHMDIRPRERGVHYQTMRKISDVLGGLSMFEKGITGNKNAEKVIDITELTVKFNETMTYMANVLNGRPVDYIAFNLFLMADVALGLLSFTWFDNLASEIQAELEARRVRK